MCYKYNIIGITRHGTYAAQLSVTHGKFDIEFIRLTFKAFESEVLAIQIEYAGRNKK